MKETWKDIPGYFGEYQASTFGRIKDKNNIVLLEHRKSGSSTNRYLKPFDYYVFVNMLGMRVPVHRIIAHTFVDGWSETQNVVDHIDRNKHNNYPNNLRWVTPKENSNNKYPRFINPKMCHMDVLSLYIQHGFTLKLTSKYTGFRVETIKEIKNAQKVYEETDSLTTKIEKLQLINFLTKSLIRFYELKKKEEKE